MPARWISGNILLNGRLSEIISRLPPRQWFFRVRAAGLFEAQS